MDLPRGNRPNSNAGPGPGNINPVAPTWSFDFGVGDGSGLAPSLRPEVGGGATRAPPRTQGPVAAAAAAAAEARQRAQAQNQAQNERMESDRPLPTPPVARDQPQNERREREWPAAGPVDGRNQAHNEHRERDRPPLAPSVARIQPQNERQERERPAPAPTPVRAAGINQPQNERRERERPTTGPVAGRNQPQNESQGSHIRERSVPVRGVSPTPNVRRNSFEFAGPAIQRRHSHHRERHSPNAGLLRSRSGIERTPRDRPVTGAGHPKLEDELQNARPNRYNDKSLARLIARTVRKPILNRISEADLRELRQPIMRCDNAEQVLQNMNVWFRIFDQAFFWNLVRPVLAGGIRIVNRPNVSWQARYVTASKRIETNLSNEYVRDGRSAEEASRGYVCHLLHEMLHAFLINYVCTCTNCLKRLPAKKGGMGNSGHGPVWANAMIELQAAFQREVAFPVDIGMPQSIELEMRASKWQPRPEQLERWGVPAFRLEFFLEAEEMPAGPDREEEGSDNEPLRPSQSHSHRRSRRSSREGRRTLMRGERVIPCNLM